MLGEFKSFLLKQNVLALAIAVVVGAAMTALVTSVVDGFIMPIVAAATPGGEWRDWTVAAGPVQFKPGLFLGALLNFVIVAFVAWRMMRLFIKPEATAVKPATKSCQYCRMEIDATASRCAHCTSQLAAASV